MPLSIIGAGFGRTGTVSAKLALEALGFGPCHHMADVVPSPEQLALWRAAARLAGGVGLFRAERVYILSLHEHLCRHMDSCTLERSITRPYPRGR